MSERVGRFKIRERIGDGLSGKVYRAYDPDSGEEIALKVFRHSNGSLSGRGGDATVLEYFKNESVVLRKIAAHGEHRHIVKYVGSNFAKEPYYIATGFVDGRSLSEQIARRPQPAWLVALIVDQIASALDYLHHGIPDFSPIVHRDVKPQNILLDEQHRAVLIDFSIASHPGFAIEDEKNLGTPGYMAPEQFHGPGAELPASDQFALAIIALEMLTGKPPIPHHTATAQRVLNDWRERNNEPVRRLLGSRYQHTAEVLIKALAPDPGQRYRHCQGFADALRQALARDGEAVEPPPPHLVSPSPHRKQDRDRSLWWLSGVIIVIAVVMLAVAFTQVTTVEPSNLTTNSIAETPIAQIPTLVPSPTSRPSIVSTLASATSTIVPVNLNTIRCDAREPLRAGPSTDTLIQTWIAAGQTLEYTGRQQPAGALIWYEVRFENRIGWVRSINCQLR